MVLSLEEAVICAEFEVASVVGLAVVVLVEDTPVVSEDLVVWLQPLRIRPRSAVIKTVFFIGDRVADRLTPLSSLGSKM